jgi:hypothetical protein
MGGFTLDTSGEVLVQRASSGGPFAYTWSDLSPFEQGYIEAAKHAHRYLMGSGRAPGGYVHVDWGFRHLAPETLAAILKDCGDALRMGSADYMRTEEHLQRAGAIFWRSRQRGGLKYRGHPPLTLSLGDDGKVYLRGAV